MAKICKAPAGFDAPEISYGSDWRAQEQAYLDRLAALARQQTPGDALAGSVVRFPHADGYAQYMVWRSKPLTLVHLELGDAWHIPDAHARGLRLADVQAMVERDRRWQQFLAERQPKAASA